MSLLARQKPVFRSPSPESICEPGRPSGSKGPQGLDPRLQAFIGEQLRLYYVDLLREPVPDRLIALLDKLDAVGGGRA